MKEIGVLPSGNKALSSMDFKIKCNRRLCILVYKTLNKIVLITCKYIHYAVKTTILIIINEE